MPNPKPKRGLDDDPYAGFRSLDGSHPLRRAVARGFVDYHARSVAEARVVFFNFALAREMGLVPADHPDRLTPALEAAVLDAFAVEILNEYEMRRSRRRFRRGSPPRGPYMATRYLQLEHPGRRGTTSGDGRSVWIGTVASGAVTWDVSACGTGVTRLCPATAWSGRFYRTGSRSASYGCGTAAVAEGLAAAILSESFHRGGIATERVLAVLARPDGYAINVRAYPCLLRPAHFLAWLKQNDLASLRGVAEAYWRRQRSNGVLPTASGRARWELLARHVARSFARATATFESEYVFCWLEWDGDNVLMDGAVLDYGSVRQFGLYHREYRYDDGPRWSTTLPEQRRKARHLVRCFAQIRDYLASGIKRPLSAYRDDPAIRLFDAEFEATRRRLLLRNAGFPGGTADALLRRHGGLVEAFRKEHRYFERARSRRGPIRVADGITWNAVYSTRDLLRELPARYLADERALEPREFLAIAASTYASRRDRAATAARALHAHAFQRAYLDLVHTAARLAGTSPRRMLRVVAERSAAVNRFARITGDACIEVAAHLARTRRRRSPESTYRVIRDLVVEHAALTPVVRGNPAIRRVRPEEERALGVLRRTVAARRHGL